MNQEWKPVAELTERGFDLVLFSDANDQPCSIQQSSAVGMYAEALDKPGTSALWLGKGDDRMHLSFEQVRGLRDLLTCWLDTGSLGQAHNRHDEGAD